MNCERSPVHSQTDIDHDILMYCQDTPAKAEIPMINVPGQRFTATHGIKIFLYIRSYLNVSPFFSLYFDVFC